MAWLIGLALVALAVYAIVTYNRLVRARNVMAEAWAGIDVQLQRRHELVPNLVAVTRQYASHESTVLEDVTRARGAAPDTTGAKAPGQHGMESLASRESDLSRALGRLVMLAEQYPELKAAQVFSQLHASLVDTEDHLQYARRYYNGAVRDLNNAVESFPANLVARLFGFRTGAFFEIEFASQREVPDVRL
ncbi:LemA family protein [Marinihelvus fidelis]|uniref:LemA family protein n=1 Tax=Marinihelvus fidelis TaxID=2613842 RepID=A0A5N0TBJ2_9GAMM|nr:LemA family protein [Marinihelvus fidelis]KAA9132038.1 LemA family protein [Marinihelvus fidelis]